MDTILPLAATWMELGDIMVSGIRHITQTPHVLPHGWKLWGKKDFNVNTECGSLGARDREAHRVKSRV